MPHGNVTTNGNITIPQMVEELIWFIGRMTIEKGEYRFSEK
jgi:hypothetical protein